MNATANQTRDDRLAIIGRAIREERAYLVTFTGTHKVVSYNDATGWAVTNDTGRHLDHHSWCVTLDDIKIAPTKSVLAAAIDLGVEPNDVLGSSLRR